MASGTRDMDLYYLLHVLHGLLQEVQLLFLRVILLGTVHIALLLLQQLHLVPVSIQLPAQTVVFLPQSTRLRRQHCSQTGRKRERQEVSLDEGLYLICCIDGMNSHFCAW